MNSRFVKRPLNLQEGLKERSLQLSDLQSRSVICMDKLGTEHYGCDLNLEISYEIRSLLAWLYFIRL